MAGDGHPNRRRRPSGLPEIDNRGESFNIENLVDEKDHRSHNGHMFSYSCTLGKFVSHPCHFLCLRCQRLGLLRPRLVVRVLLALIISILVYVSCKQYFVWRIHPLRPRSDWEVNRIAIQISYFDYSLVDDVGGWIYPGRDRVFPSFARMQTPVLKEKFADFGGLIIHSIQDPTQLEIKLGTHDNAKYEAERTHQIADMDLFEMSPLYWHDDELDHVVCHRPNWRSLYFPNCNNFHEFDLSRDYEVGFESQFEQNVDSYRFNHGFYREAWVVNNVELSEQIVLKTLRGNHDFIARIMLMVQRDAIIMERLTSSPRIIDMYGHCGTSITVEPISYELELYAVPNGYMKKTELGDQYDVKPQNDFEPNEKLAMSLEMAESLAEMHGFVGGVIVHDDVQLCQWLRTKRGTLVLGDFNRAEIMNWDNDKQDYCRYSNGLSFGNWRSPEEFNGKDLNEKIDIFSLGNNMYGLLTGLWVFYENEDDTVVQKEVVAGSRAFIDERYRSRSYAEKKLVEAIEMCWEYDPDRRIDIFYLIRFLREAVDGVNALTQGDKGGGNYPEQAVNRKRHDQAQVGFEFSKD